MEQIKNIKAAQSITRGACRLLANMGYAVIREFRVKSGRRVDIAGLNKAGKFIVVEVKSSPADFQSDSKWHEYLDFCDTFFFAVNSDFPKELLPPEHGIIIADAYGAIIDQDSGTFSMNGQRRRSQTIRFARTAATRLETHVDIRR
jgi:hypothetical protein